MAVGNKGAGEKGNKMIRKLTTDELKKEKGWMERNIKTVEEKQARAAAEGKMSTVRIYDLYKAEYQKRLDAINAKLEQPEVS